MPEYGIAAFPNVWWSGRREGRQDRIAAMTKLSGHAGAPNGALTRRDTLVIASAAAAPRWRLQPLRPSPKREPSATACRLCDLKYPADFKHFELRHPDAPKAARFSHSGPQRQFNQNFLTFNTFNALILRATAPWASRTYLRR